MIVKKIGSTLEIKCRRGTGLSLVVDFERFSIKMIENGQHLMTVNPNGLGLLYESHEKQAGYTTLD
jgi:hypothetical protein